MTRPRPSTAAEQALFAARLLAACMTASCAAQPPEPPPHDEAPADLQSPDMAPIGKPPPALPSERPEIHPDPAHPYWRRTRPLK